MESFRTRDWTCVPCVGRWVLYHWVKGKSRIVLRAHSLPSRMGQFMWTACHPQDQRGEVALLGSRCKAVAQVSLTPESRSFQFLVWGARGLLARALDGSCLLEGSRAECQAACPELLHGGTVWTGGKVRESGPIGNFSGPCVQCSERFPGSRCATNGPPFITICRDNRQI